MSRSRRRVRHGKCCCGAHLVPFKERGAGPPGCPTLERVHDANDMFLKFRELRSRSTDDGDTDE